MVGRLPDKDANFRLYKALAVHQWAQNWYGTWRGGHLLGAVEAGLLPEEQLDTFHALETVRIDACIARDFPGLHRDMAALRTALGDNDAWRYAADALCAPDARVTDTLMLTAALQALPRHDCCYQGDLRPEAVRACLDRRSELERDRFRIALAKLIEEQDGEDKDVDSVWSGTYHEEGAFIYDEWDHSREHHRKGRICGIKPRDYTRMGAPIRHPFCITIDEEGPDYLPHMYGAANYTLVSDVTKLPMKVSDIYRKLTS